MFAAFEKNEPKTLDDDRHSTSTEDCLSDDQSLLETTVNGDRLRICLESLHILRDVAEELGVENTRKYLIPHVTNLIIAEELPELYDLTVILGEFECYMGGPRYAHILLLPLEELAGAKVIDVRIAAIKSLQALAGVMEVSELETYFIPLITSMTINDKCAKRWSACQLFSTVYMRVSPKHQDDLIDYHYFLSVDAFSLVRQCAAKSLANLSEVVHLEVFDKKLISRLEQFSCDQNEYVRASALSAAISILKIYDNSYVKKKILPIILNNIKDQSWGVRLILIKNIIKLLIVGISCQKLTENIIQLFILSTKDQKLEIRQQSVSTLYDFTVVLYENLIDSEANKIVTEFLIPTLCDLTRDSDVKCKLEIPVVLAKLGKIIPNELIKNYFVGLINDLLQDKNVDIVFNIVKYLKDILGSQYTNLIVLPEDRLLCCLKAFIINDSWQIRNTGAIYLGILSTQMGLLFFKEYLEQSFLMLLTDTISVVQQTAIDVFKLLVTEFGMDWAQTNIVQYLLKLSYSKNTSNKMALLSFAKVCATIMCLQFKSLYMKESAVKL